MTAAPALRARRTSRIHVIPPLPCQPDHPVSPGGSGRKSVASDPEPGLSAHGVAPSTRHIAIHAGRVGVRNDRWTQGP